MKTKPTHKKCSTSDKWRARAKAAFPDYNDDNIFDDGLMRATEAARVLSMSTSAVFKLLDDGLLPWVHLGKVCRRIPRRAVEIVSVVGTPYAD